MRRRAVGPFLRDGWSQNCTPLSVTAKGSGGTAYGHLVIDVAAFASFDGRKLCIMVWHYHDDDLRGPDAAIELSTAGLGKAKSALLTHYRIDETHSNSYAEWKRLGSPIAPNDAQYAQLEKAGKLSALVAQEPGGPSGSA